MSWSTIKRRLADQAFPHAYRVQGDQMHQLGSWLIPVTDLLAAGYRLHAPRSAGPAESVAYEPPGLARGPASGSPESAGMGAELAQLRRRVDVAEWEAAEWRARAEERERAFERFERLFAPQPQLPAAEAPPPHRRRWGRRWQR